MCVNDTGREETWHKKKRERKRPKATLALPPPLSWTLSLFPYPLSHTYAQEQDRGNRLSYQWANAVAFWQFQLVAWNWPLDSSYSLKTSIYNTTGCYTAPHQTHNQPKAKTSQNNCAYQAQHCHLSVGNIPADIKRDIYRRIQLLFIATQPGPVAPPQLLT